MGPMGNSILPRGSGFHKGCGVFDQRFTGSDGVVYGPEGLAKGAKQEGL